MKRKASEGVKPALKRQKTTLLVVPTKTTKKTLKSIPDELKYNDVAITGDATTTETVVALTTFAAGDTALLRDGNKIICKSLELRIHLTNEALTQSNVVRFVVVQSLQANAAAPTWFTTAATDVFDASTITARRAVATASTYRIIMDKTIVVNQTGSTGGAFNMEYFHKYIKLPDEITTFSSSNAVIPMTNAYFLMYVGSTAAGATDLDVSGTARLRFVG